MTSSQVKEAAGSVRISILHIVLASMKSRQMRAWLTVLGIVVGVAAIIALISVGEGMENAIEERLDRIGFKNMRIVTPGLRGPPMGDMVIQESWADKVEKVVGVDYVNPVIMNSAKATYHNEDKYFSVASEKTDVSAKGFADLDVKIQDGRNFKPGERGVTVIGHTVANEAFERDISIRTGLEVDDKKFKVIGIFEKTGTGVDSNIYIPFDDAKKLFKKSGEVNAIVVTLLPGVEREEVKSRITRMLDRVAGEDNYEIFEPSQIVELVNSTLGVVQFILGGIAAISLVVGGLGIMNSMYTSVLERTRDIGIMKAIGAKNSQILQMFMLESALTGLTGGVIGVLSGLAVAKSVELVSNVMGYDFIVIEVEWWVISLGLGFSLAVGILAGVLPALRAAWLKPVEALRYE